MQRKLLRGRAARAIWRLLLFVPLGLMWEPAVVVAAPPITPLPMPDYSFDANSPTVIEGLVAAGDVLNPALTSPEVVIPADALGFPDAGDDLDGLSGPNDLFPLDQPFMLLYSVDRETVGTVPPDPEFVLLEVPYNAWDQADRGHAAGDQYMSTLLFTRLGRVRGGGTGNGVLSRNNYDEGGTDFTAQPETTARDRVSRSNQDRVDAFALLERDPGTGNVAYVYYSATAGSPSAGSGADILFSFMPFEFSPPMVYASFLDLGLTEFDDIDALIVFDANRNGVYDPPDQVLFSLAPGSPSLDSIPGASLEGAAADVFSVRPGQAPTLFASAADLGLGQPLDNVDALDYFPCGDVIACASEHGIRALFGDLNCDDLVNAFDIDPFILALTDPGQYQQQYPNCQLYLADMDRNGQINAFDIDPFIERLTGG